MTEYDILRYTKLAKIVQRREEYEKINGNCIIAFALYIFVLLRNGGEGGEVPDIEEEKEQHGSYYNKEEEEEPVLSVQPQTKPQAPQEEMTDVLGAKIRRTLFWILFVIVMDIELCLCSAIIIPVLSKKLNLDDIYTLKSGSYWIVHVNLTKNEKYIRAAVVKK